MKESVKYKPVEMKESVNYKAVEMRAKPNDVYKKSPFPSQFSPTKSFNIKHVNLSNFLDTPRVDERNRPHFKCIKDKPPEIQD